MTRASLAGPHMRTLALALAFLLVASAALAAHQDGKGARSLGGEGVPRSEKWLHVEAESFPKRDVGRSESDGTAVGGEAWNLTTYGLITMEIDVPTTGVSWVDIRARGHHPAGMMNPHMHILIDGEQRAEWDVRGDWLTYPQAVPLLAGKHVVSVENFNNYRAPVEDRSLVVDWIEFTKPSLEGTPRVPAGGSVVVDAAKIQNSVTGQLERSTQAREGTQWLQWGIGCFVQLFVFEGAGAHELTARLRGNVWDDVGTHVIVRLDGTKIDEYHVGEAWEDERTRFDVSTGAHAIEICYDNDLPGEKRNLWLDDMRVAAGEVAHAPAWPSAHGGLSNHRHQASAIDAKSVLGAQKAWTYKAAGPVTGTPAVDAGVAYFADHGGKVHAVRLADGTPVWSVTRPAGADSSVALDSTRVYVGDQDGWLNALSRADGAEVWRVRADPVEGTHLYGSPVVHDGVLYTGVASEQTLIEYEGPQTFRGSVAAFDAADGSLLWRTHTQTEDGLGVSVWSTPALDPEIGLLFVGTGNSYGEPVSPYTDSILALRMEDGGIVWHHQATKGDAFNARGGAGPDADFGASPLLFEAAGRRVVGDGDKGGRFFALDRATGELVWTAKADFRVEGAPPSQVEGFLGTASHHDGRIYAPTTARSMVHAIDAATGKIAWATELNPLPRTYGDRMFAPSTAADGVVLQGNAFGYVFALDAATGAILANLTVGGGVQGGIALAGDVFLVPHVGPNLWSGQGGLVAFRVKGGFVPTTPIASTPSTPGVTPSPTGPGPIDTGETAAEIPVGGLGVLTLVACAAAAWRRRAPPR